jgi:AcrR family transcriptional regulator
MASVISTRRVDKTAPPAGLNGDSRRDRRLAQILGHATKVFCEKGYAAASMRDLSRATGMSLAGLYYYFESKEKLLYRIQKHTFETILERLQERLQGVGDAEQRLRILIHNHLEYFLANRQAMKVLAHESDVLGGKLEEDILDIKRRYYQLCRELVEAVKAGQSVDGSSRLAVLSLFGMMNWIYTWHNARVDADAAEVARQMGDLVLYGLLRPVRPKRESIPVKPGVKSAARNRHAASSRSELLKSKELP